jgi:hypothetical protein
MPARRMSKWKSHRLMRYESMPIVSKEDWGEHVTILKSSTSWTNCLINLWML